MAFILKYNSMVWFNPVHDEVMDCALVYLYSFSMEATVSISVLWP